MQIAIPTYGRAQTIGTHVLSYLRSTDINLDDVTLFVASEAERDAYSTFNPDLRVVVGKKGLTNQRQFISGYYPAGTPVFSMDDDVSGIDPLSGLSTIGKQRKTLSTQCTLSPVFKLAPLLRAGFDRCEKHGVGLWGFYPVRNKGFMQPKISLGLKFIMGHAFGFFAGDRAFDEITSYNMKDDYYLTLFHFANARGSLRFDGICVRSKAHSGSGGTCDDMERKLRVNNGSVMRLCGEYPTLAAYKVRRTADTWLARYLELRLRAITYSEENFAYL